MNFHHLYNYSTHPDKRLDLENGITLCFDCHSPNSKYGFHKIYGKTNNTPEQFYEYKIWRRQQLGIDENDIERREGGIEGVG